MNQKSQIDHESNSRFKRISYGGHNNRSLRNSQTIHEGNNWQSTQGKQDDLEIISDSEKENNANGAVNACSQQQRSVATARKLHYTDTLDEPTVEIKDDNIDMQIIDDKQKIEQDIQSDPTLSQ